jgi:hypothetical protein
MFQVILTTVDNIGGACLASVKDFQEARHIVASATMSFAQLLIISGLLLAVSTTSVRHTSPVSLIASKAFFVSAKDISNACRIRVVDTGDNIKHRQHHSSVWLTRGEGFLTGTKTLYGEKCYMMTVHYSIQETSGN